MTVGFWKSFSVSVSQEESRITEFEVVGIFSEILFQRKVGKEESIERRGDRIFRKIKHRFIELYVMLFILCVCLQFVYQRKKDFLKENAFI